MRNGGSAGCSISWKVTLAMVKQTCRVRQPSTWVRICNSPEASCKRTLIIDPRAPGSHSDLLFTCSSIALVYGITGNGITYHGSMAYRLSETGLVNTHQWKRSFSCSPSLFHPISHPIAMHEDLFFNTLETTVMRIQPSRE